MQKSLSSIKKKKKSNEYNISQLEKKERASTIKIAVDNRKSTQWLLKCNVM